MNSKILIVEDDLAIRQLLITALNSFGYTKRCFDWCEAVETLSTFLI